MGKLKYMYNEKLSKQKNGAEMYMKNIIIVHYGSVVNYFTLRES